MNTPSWKEFSRSTEFQNLPPEKRARARDSFFQQAVVPAVPESELPELQQQWYQATEADVQGGNSERIAYQRTAEAPEPEPEPSAGPLRKIGTWLKDTGTSVARGGVNTASAFAGGAEWGGRKSGLLSEDAPSGAEALRGLSDRMDESMSEGARDRRDSFQMFGDDRDWRGADQVVAEGVGSMGTSIGIGGPLSFVAKKGLTKAGASEKVANTAGSMVGFGIFGGTTGGEISREMAENELAQIPVEILSESPVFRENYQQLMASGQPQSDQEIEQALEQARVQTVNDLADEAFADGFFRGTALYGALGPAYDKIARGIGGPGQRVTHGAATEFMQEGMDSGAARAQTNRRLTEFDGRPIMRDVFKEGAEAGILGAISGGIVGGGRGSVRDQVEARGGNEQTAQEVEDAVNRMQEGAATQDDVLLLEQWQDIQLPDESAPAREQAQARAQQPARLEQLPEPSELIYRGNGQPFAGRGDARASQQFRNNREQGAKVVPVDGGFAIQVPRANDAAIPMSDPQGRTGDPVIGDGRDGFTSQSQTQPMIDNPAPVQTTTQTLNDLANAAERVDQMTAEGIRPSVQGETGTRGRVKIKDKYQDVDFMLVDLAKNPTMRPEFNVGQNQNRDRTRAAYSEQVQRIASNLDFNELGNSARMSEGAPTLTQEGVIIGGNGRIAAILDAYQRGNADNYRQELAQRAGEFGINPDTINTMEQPALVRRFTQPVDVALATMESNVQTGASMSALEQARIDGGLLQSIPDIQTDATGGMNSPANRDFIRQFVNSLPANERNTVAAADGSLSQTGVTRLRNALLYRAYGDTDVLASLVEATDTGRRNILNSLVQSSPKAAQVRDAIDRGELYDLDIAAEIVDAVGIIKDVAARDLQMNEYLAQGDLVGGVSDTAKDIARVFDAKKNSAKAIADFINAYYDRILSAGNPSQVSMFGDSPIDSQALLAQSAQDIGVFLNARETQDTGTREGRTDQTGADPGGAEADPPGSPAEVEQPDTPEAAPAASVDSGARQNITPPTQADQQVTLQDISGEADFGTGRGLAAVGTGTLESMARRNVREFEHGGRGREGIEETYTLDDSVDNGSGQRVAVLSRIAPDKDDFQRKGFIGSAVALPEGTTEAQIPQAVYDRLDAQFKALQSDRRASGRIGSAIEQFSNRSERRAQETDFDLQTQTEQQLADQETAQQETAAQQQREQREAEQRAEADREANDFVLAGSDAAVDQAEARGQNNLFDQSESKPDQETQSDIDRAAAETNTDPSEAQIEAENYKKGRVRIQGLDIAIENPKGSTRRGTDPNGNQWESTMAHHYGDIKRTQGNDGDNVDVFIGDNPDSDRVFVIDQVKRNRHFDEHKVMLGFNTEAQARKGYLDNYMRGWKGLGEITETTMDNFNSWLQDGDTGQPFAAESAESAESAELAPSGEPIVTHTTKKKTLEGVVRNVTKEEAQAVDRYTFKKDDGYFIRLKHVTADQATQAPVRPQESRSEQPAQGIDAELASLTDGELEAMIDDVAGNGNPVETEKPKPQRTRKKTTGSGRTTPKKVRTKPESTDPADADAVERTSSEIAKSFGVNLSDGGKEALNGLTKLFGGNGRLNSGLSFDEATYREAKPHFVKMYQDFKAAGKDLRELIKAMIDNFGTGIKPYIVRFAQDVRAGNMETEAATPAPVTETTGDALADALYDQIDSINNNNHLKKALAEHHGIAVSEVSETQIKAGQEAIELAITRRARDIVGAMKGHPQRDVYDRLVTLYENQPVLNSRSSSSIQRQAYSTPAPIAYLASELGRITGDSTVYEPTAGNGMLVIGADPAKVTANELDDTRTRQLKAQGFEVTQNDASSWVPGQKHDTAIMNPPFGSMKDAKGNNAPVQYDGFKLQAIDHVITARALEAMKDDGRAVIIIGADKDAGKIGPRDRVFFNWLYGNYNVASHFEIDGKAYNRQGAGWPIRLITVAGRQKSDQVSPRSGSIERVAGWSDIYDQFNDGLAASEPVRTGTEGADAGSATQSEAGSVSTRNDAGAEGGLSDSRGSGRGNRLAGQSQGERAVSGRGRGDRATTDSRSDDVGRNNRPTNQRSGSKGQAQQQGQSGTAAADTGSLRGRSDGGQGTAVSSSEFQTAYETQSGGFNEAVLIPNNMAQGTKDYLGSLEASVGNIDQYVTDKLGYSNVKAMQKSFMGLQVDAIAAFIHNNENRDRSIIIADQTGVGKGRQAAAIIRYAREIGKTPIFVTVGENLFSDMYGDAMDIGDNDLRPFVVNKDAKIIHQNSEVYKNKKSTHSATLQKIANSGTLPDGTNALFLTYSQIRTENVQRKVVSKLADNAIFVLDEAHNVSGERESKVKGGGVRVTGAGFMYKAIEKSPVLYLSATYAKRPDNMPVYYRTDLADAVDNVDQLVDAVGSGGVPLQTVISGMLAQSGQLFRRERSFEGIKVETNTDVENAALHSEISDKVTTGLRAIIEADRAFHGVAMDNIKDQVEGEGSSAKGAGNKASSSVDHQNFTSVVHNYISQLLLGLKAERAAQMAIDMHRDGVKPVIGLENTMGAFLSQFAEENGLQPGDDVDATYQDVLLRALERTRRYSIKLPSGNSEAVQVAKSDLDSYTLSAYNRAERAIRDIDLADLPISPIDLMRQRMSEAGMNVAELTGRKTTVDYSGDTPLISARPAEEMEIRRTVDKFNDGRLDALVINVAGSTGLSIHSSENFKDKKPRHMIIAQAPRDINILMQMLGRINRTGQVELPGYTMMGLAIPAEKRPLAVTSRKMKSLNANTSANDKSDTSVDAPDILNKYGNQVVNEYLANNPDLARKLDISPDVSESGEVKAPPEGLAEKFTGRLATQPVKVQEKAYAEIETAYTDLMDYLNKTGQNDLETQTLDMDASIVESRVMYEGKAPETIFGGHTFLHKINSKYQGNPPTAKDASKALEKALSDKSETQIADELIRKLERAEGRYRNEIDQTLEQIKEAEGELTTAINDAGQGGKSPMQAITALKSEDNQESAKSIEDAMEAVQGLVSRHDRESKKLESTMREAKRAITRTFLVGNRVRLDLKEETVTGVVTGIKNSHKSDSSGNPYAPSKTKIRFMVNSGIRTIELPLSRVMPGQGENFVEQLQGRGMDGLDQVFRDDLAGSDMRETRYVATGNLVAASAKGTGGRIVGFTDSEGTMHQGLLMPKKFSQKDFDGMEVSNNFPVRDNRVLAKFLRDHRDAVSRAGGVFTEGQEVRLFTADNGSDWVISVPKSNKEKVPRAVKFNADLMKAMGTEFVGRSKTMRATFGDAKLPAVLESLQTVAPLYALPSQREAWVRSGGAAAPAADSSFENQAAAGASQDQDTRFSLSKRGQRGSGLTTKIVQRTVDRLKVNWKGGVNVVQSVADLPEGIRNQINSAGATGVRGVFQNSNDAIWLVADNLDSAKTVEQVLAHELIGHAGVRGMFGSGVNPILDALWKKELTAEMLQPIADNYGLDLNNLSQRREAIEEYIAHRAQYGKKPVGWLAQVVAQVRRLLRKMGFINGWSDADIMALMANHKTTSVDAIVGGSARRLAGMSGNLSTGRGHATRMSLKPKDASQFGQEAAGLARKAESLRPKVEKAYETNAENAAQLDSQLDVIYSRLEEIMVASEEDGPTVDALNREAIARMDQTAEFEPSWDMDLARRYAEVFLGSGHDSQGSRQEKIDRLRMTVEDIANNYGGMKEGVTDQQIFEAAKDAYESTGSRRRQGRPKLTSGVGRLIDPANPDIRFSINPFGRKKTKDFASEDAINSHASEFAKLRGFWNSASDVLREKPKLAHLADAIDQFYDRTRQRMGSVNAVIDQAVHPVRKLSRDRQRVIYREFESYMRARENGRTKEAAEILQGATQHTQKLIEAWQEVGVMTGKENQKVGVKVFDAKLNKWRPIGRVREFFPRMMRPDIQEAIHNYSRHPDIWDQMAQELFDSGRIEENTHEAAAKYLRSEVQNFDEKTRSDYFAGIEKARTEPLPEFFYDYSWDAAMAYKDRWGENVSRIEAFGQYAVTDSDLLTKAANKTLDSRTQNYIMRVRDRVYDTKVNSPYMRIMGQLNMVATGIMLGNPATAMLNLIGGTAINFQVGGTMNGMKSVVETLRHLGAYKLDAREKGILVDDYLTLFHDAEQQGASRVLQKGVNSMLKYGGYTPMEVFIRTHGMVVGRNMLRSAISSWNQNMHSAKSKRYIAWYQRNGFDYRTLLAENGKGAETDRLLRYTVNIGQGSYKVNQTPVFVDEPIGRFLFKYQKFGTQYSRLFWRNMLRPFMVSIRDGGEKIQYEEGGKQYSARVKTFVPLLQFFGVSILAGTALAGLREALFGYTDPGPDFDELEKALENDDTALALALAANRAFSSMMAVGGMGFFGNYFQMMRDVQDRQRVKSPLSPPALAPLQGISDLVLRFFEQGNKITLRDLDDVATSTLSQYRTGRRLAETALSPTDFDFARLGSARRDRFYARKMARRYAAEIGLENKRRAPDRFGVTEMSETTGKVVDALLLGNSEQVTALIWKHMEGLETVGEVESAMASIKAAARNGQPARVSLSPSQREQVEFMTWLENRVGDDSYNRVKRLNDRYTNAAIRAGLMNPVDPREISRQRQRNALSQRKFRSNADRIGYMRSQRIRTPGQ